MQTEMRLEHAAHAIASADALLIGAGAGMGVDSGLPDFRGNYGFWQAYPPYQRLGLKFVELANPRWFETDRALAWGFYGHRMDLYRQTQPHDGFRILLSWAKRMKHGGFVYTSNVDGHFQKAGFSPDRVLEIHGSVEWLQCMRSCGVGIFPAESYQVQVDPASMRAEEPLPRCPVCGSLARPNVLMFEDRSWEPERAMQQEARLGQWLDNVNQGPMVIVECGAGTAIPSVRHFCERLAAIYRATLIRLNLREPHAPKEQFGLAMGA
ncbi:MAG TPA: Sir2 family NAD-dependent protein deacetylase, partial [Gemmataceae bacterium]|nr:Sir2 family NAD-dependent protein deacetylase [Gemmataceae bacterium]